MGDSQASTPAELTLTHVEVLLAAGLLMAAEDRLEQCLQICAERGLEGIRVRAMAVQAELLATRGDFEKAYAAHREFHAASERRRSQRLESAARVRQAVFETAEARRDARRFWSQARSDPLTGLPNRRWLDERLPRHLTAGRAPRRCLAAAVVDVDHFKQINDRYSHDVGDMVLRELAALLSGPEQGRALAGEEVTAGPPEDEIGDVAARLGGEEFLVALLRPGPEEAVAAFETLRTSVEAHDWCRIAPGLMVTVSMGVAVLQDDDTHRSLVTRADHHLYDAKRSGRNRVVADAVVHQRRPLPGADVQGPVTRPLG